MFNFFSQSGFDFLYDLVIYNMSRQSTIADGTFRVSARKKQPTCALPMLPRKGLLKRLFSREAVYAISRFH